MKNIHFPTTIIDGFFENPNSIREFALNQEYFFDDTHHYPGKRCKPISDLNRLLFDSVSLKFLQLFFSKQNLSFNATMNFQLVGEEMESGWIHRDDAIATAIIYLTPNDGTVSIGTSLYRKKDIFYDPILMSENFDKKQHSIKMNKIDSQSKKQLNDQFEETINVKGLYNRALLFDGHLYHAAHNYIGNEPNNNRLTLVAFFNEISCGKQILPIPRIHSSALTIL